MILYTYATSLDGCENRKKDFTIFLCASTPGAAAWADMKYQLANALGEEVKKKMYALRYVDPVNEGKTSLVRNEEEWQVRWHLRSSLLSHCYRMSSHYYLVSIPLLTRRTCRPVGRSPSPKRIANSRFEERETGKERARTHARVNMYICVNCIKARTTNTHMHSLTGGYKQKSACEAIQT